ncbi:MAG: histidine kinase [Prolixibacteraceae bacterium]|nr:histidine kinase [Prolixibacteraceae bacterium]
MKHPLLSNLKYLLLYGIFWIFVTFGNAMIMWNSYNTPFGLALVFSLVNFTLYAALGLSIWYVVQYNTPENYSIWSLLLIHLLVATILNFIWVYASSVVVKMLVPELADYTVSSTWSNFFSGYLLYAMFVLFYMVIVYYQNFKEKVTRESELKSLVKEAELHALKSQINPHFLFNSLNSISSLTMSDPAKAQEMVINLSNLMRYSLKHDQSEKVPFGEEFQNNQLYMAIEKVRFGSKLQPVFDVDEKCYDAFIPNMLLQPIYENAIKYGVYEATSPVDIITVAICKDGMLKISVENSYDPNAVAKKGEGIGLRNIRDRLQIIFGNPLLLKVEDNKNTFKVTLTIPQN